MLTANGHWYDVKKFSVVMRYQVMKRPAVKAPAAPLIRLVCLSVRSGAR